MQVRLRVQQTFFLSLQALLKWIEGVELLFESESFLVNNAEVTQEQLTQYKVRTCVLIVHVGVPPMLYPHHTHTSTSLQFSSGLINVTKLLDTDGNGRWGRVRPWLLASIICQF